MRILYKGKSGDTLIKKGKSREDGRGKRFNELGLVDVVETESNQHIVYFNREYVLLLYKSLLEKRRTRSIQPKSQVQTA